MSATIDQSKFNAFISEIKDVMLTDMDDETYQSVISHIQGAMINAGICLVSPSVSVAVPSVSAPAVKTAGRLNSYTLFMKERSSQLKAEGITGSAMTTAVAAEWKLKTDAEKAEWKTRADTENNNNGVVKGTGVRKSSGPTAYNIFIKTRTAELKAQGVATGASAQALAEWKLKKATASA